MILVPRNGLGNRLQAWSSAALLARAWDVPLDVMWEPEQAASTPASELFVGAPTFNGLDHAFLDRVSLDRILGADHAELPRYVHAEPARQFISFAGHDKGEQALLDELFVAIQSDHQLKMLVIIAGGLFTLNPRDDMTFRRGREDFYRSLPWHPAISERAAQIEVGNEYSALHIRGTDRSREAPTRRVIERSLQHMRESGTADSLFIAADNAPSRQEWTRRSQELGFTPWSVGDTDFTRSAHAGGISAAVDWLLLSRSSFIAYPGASTFSAEACVANGGAGIAMYASTLIRGARAAREVGGNVVSYPRRHGWRLGKR